MNEVKRLGIISTIFFFPAAIAGWVYYENAPETAVKFFRAGIYVAIVWLSAFGFYAVTKGPAIVEALGTFF